MFPCSKIMVIILALPLSISIRMVFNKHVHLCTINYSFHKISAALNHVNTFKTFNALFNLRLSVHTEIKIIHKNYCQNVITMSLFNLQFKIKYRIGSYLIEIFQKIFQKILSHIIARLTHL